jgi:hypothetical protein
MTTDMDNFRKGILPFERADAKNHLSCRSYREEASKLVKFFD